MTTFGKKAAKKNDSFEAKSNEMSTVIRAKRADLAEHKRQSNERNLQILRQKTAGRCA